MFITTSDGVQLYVERSGKGVPCIFLHGGPGYWSGSFRQLAGHLLEEDFEMIYFDQRGCGRSSHHCEDYSLERFIQDIEEVRRQLDLENCYVLGHSFGGILALTYAYQFPTYIRGVILSNVTLHMRESFIYQINKGRELLGLEPRHVEDSQEELMDQFYTIIAKLVKQDLYKHLQFKDVACKRQIDEIDRVCTSNPVVQQYIFSSSDYFQDFTLLTEEIDKPVLILTGAYDHAVGPNHHKLFYFPHLYLHVFDCGHHPYVEVPLEYKRIMVNFLHKKASTTG